MDDGGLRGDGDGGGAVVTHSTPDRRATIRARFESIRDRLQNGECPSDLINEFVDAGEVARKRSDGEGILDSTNQAAYVVGWMEAMEFVSSWLDRFAA